MRRGASLVEAVVTIAVLAATLPAILAATGYAAGLARGAAMTERAVALAEAVLDTVLHVPGAMPAAGSRGPFEIELDTQDRGTAEVLSLTVRFHTGRRLEELRFDAIRIPIPPLLDSK